MILKNVVEAYTDGSCNTQYKIGAWAAILFIGDNEFILKNTETNTTNQRIELQAVLNVLEYIRNENIDYSNIIIYTDSQYVAGIERRMEKFKNQDYKTNAGEPIRNIDLVKKLVFYIENMQIDFVKVKAHQKTNDTKNYNRFVDKLCRKMVREYVKKL